MIQKLVSQIPTSDVFVKLNLETQYYTKQEVNQLIAEAVAEARRIDEESMRKHNRDATICLLYTSPSPRDRQKSRMPSSA